MRTSSRKCCTARLSIRPRHSRADSSSSTRKPIETTSRRPSGPPSVPGTGNEWGVMTARSPSSSRPSRRPSMPSMRGIEKPQMSASMMPTFRPGGGQGRGQVDRDRRLADPALARGDGQDLGGGRDGGVAGPVDRVLAGHVHRGRLLLGRELTPADLDLGHPGERLDPGLGVLLDLGPEGAARGGEGDVDGDQAVGADRGPLAMPSSTMLLPSSGSMTPRRTFMTAASSRPSVPSVPVLGVVAVGSSPWVRLAGAGDRPRTGRPDRAPNSAGRARPSERECRARPDCPPVPAPPR